MMRPVPAATLSSAVLLATLFVGPAAAQATGAAPPTVSSSPRAARPVLADADSADRAEPNVRRAVVEDEGSRIEELRVRGQVQKISVQPKVGPKKGYQIITHDAGQDPFDGTGGPRSAVGKRVWSVLSF
jgi:Protein of unknown function (DUF2782)